MSKTLIIHSSVHGQTVKICQHICQILQQAGEQVDLVSLSDNPDITDYDKVLIGASIRHGKHRPELYEFISRNQSQLEQKQNGFFAVSLVARKPAKNTPETNPYMQEFLAKTTWKPEFLQVFAGNLDYQGYGVMDRNIIRFIMWITKGPTDPNTQIEFTPWDKVDEFAQQFHQSRQAA